MSSERIEKIDNLIKEWKQSLQTHVNQTEPTMNHHKLLMLVAEELVERSTND